MIPPNFPPLLRPSAGFCVLLAAMSVICCAHASDPLVEPGPQALTNTLAQIAALQREARALSSAQKKIATPLLDALREFRGAAPRSYAPKLRSALTQRPGGKILVDIRGRVSESLVAHLKAQRGDIHNSYPQYESIRAEVPLAALEIIAAHEDVKFIRPAALGVANVGTATSEGFYAESVDSAQSHFNVTGTGVKLGLLSDSVRHGATSQSSGDLGGVIVLDGQSGIGTNNDLGEGTAMLEIVYDLAPGAQLFFATSLGGDAAMASNIIALADAGCNIIVDDYSYFDESPFHANQPITRAVQTVSDRGILYFSSSANSGNFKSGTSGTWEGNFTNYGVDPNRGQLQDWGGTPYNQITVQGRGITLFWSDPMGGATNDYDLFITDVIGNVVRQNINQQTGQDLRDRAGDPYESVAAGTNSGEYVVVALASGTRRDIYLCTEHGQLAHGTSSNTRGHNAAPAENAFCVAAASAKGIGPGFIFAGGTKTSVEAFSSDGFPRLFYETDGSAVTPADLTATGGRLLVKPDITAADGVIASTHTFGTNLSFTPFYGTSAAAPHAGAIAALLKSYRPDLTPAQVRAAMMNTALDIETLGFDLDSGAGIVMAEAALLSVDNTPPLIAVTSPANASVVQSLSSISGTASDIGSGLQLNQVHFTLNNNGNFWSGTYWTNTPATDPSVLLTSSVNNGAWTFTSVPTGGAQVQGTYVISAFARDNSGNTSTPVSGVNSTTFRIDTEPPQVAFTSPTNGTLITSTLPPIAGTAFDASGMRSVDLYILRLSDNEFWDGTAWAGGGSAILPTSYDPTAHTWVSTGPLPILGGSDPLTKMSNGSYDLIAIAYDKGGNQQRTDSVVVVNNHPVFFYTGQACCPPPPGTPGDPSDWFDSRNWSPSGVPGSTDVAVIDGFNVNFGSSVIVAGLTLRSGSITGASLGFNPADAGNGLDWQGGTLNCSVVIQANGQMTMSGGADKHLNGGSIIVLGTASWSGSGTLFTYAGSVVNNSGIFTVLGDAQAYNLSGGAPQPLFINTGTFAKIGGTNTAFSGNNGGIAFNNNGTVSVQSGVLSLGGGGTSSNGVFNASAGAGLDWSAGSVVLKGNTTFSGAGTNRVNGAALTCSDGTSTMSGGNNFEVAGGTVAGTNSFAGTGSFNWSGGSISAHLALSAGVSFNLGGNANESLSGGVISFAGEGTWSGTGTLFASTGGILSNSGTFTVLSDAQAYNLSGGTPQPVFINTGTFAKTGGTNTLFSPNNGGIAFNNNGAISVQSGVLSLGGGGTGTNGSFNAAAGTGLDWTAGTLILNGNTTFSGAGTNRVNGAALTFSDGTSTMSGGNNFEVAGGTVAGTNSFAGTGSFNWSGGSISAHLALSAGVSFNLGGSANESLSGGVVSFAGEGTWSGTGTLFASTGGILSNSGTFTVLSDAQAYNLSGGTPQPVFINTGTFAKTGGTNTLFSPNNGGIAFNNNGAISVQSGVLSLGGGGTGTNGSFNAAAGTGLDWTAGTLIMNGNTTFGGAGTNRVDGATLTFTGGTSTMSGGNNFEVAGGTVAGANNFDGTGSFNWRGGSISAHLALSAGVNFNLGGSANESLSGGVVSFAGAGTWSGTGTLFASTGSILSNSGTFTVLSDAQAYNLSGGTPQPVFINTGTFAKTGGTNTLFSPNNGGIAFNNNGAISVQSGVLSLGGGGTGTNGSFNAAAGTGLDWTAGTLILNGNTTFSGAGTNRVNGAALTFSDGTSTMSGGNNFEVAGGTVAGTNSFAGTGSFNWSGGSISASLSLAAAVSLNLSGSNNKSLSGGTISSAGPGTWSGTGILYASAGSVLRNSGTFTVLNDAVAYNISGGTPQPVFINNGTFLKTFGTNTVFSPNNGGIRFDNNGTVDLRTGALSAEAGYAASPSSQLKLVIGGRGPGALLSQLNVAGAAALAGTVSVSLVGGFSPTNGDSFSIVNYSSLATQFSAQQLPALASGRTWKLDYGATALTLRVQPFQGFQNPGFSAGGNFGFDITGPASLSAIVLVSTDFIKWDPIFTNAPFSGSVHFSDPAITESQPVPLRVYWVKFQQ